MPSGHLHLSLCQNEPHARLLVASPDIGVLGSDDCPVPVSFRFISTCFLMALRGCRLRPAAFAPGSDLFAPGSNLVFGDRASLRFWTHLRCARLLVLFQLNRANGANAVQRMLKPAEFTVTIAKVPVDATTPGDMIRVVRVCDREASQHPELRLDQIEPRRFSGSPHRLDAQSPQQGEERRMVVDVAQVIHDDEQASTGIAGAEASKGL